MTSKLFVVLALLILGSFCQISILGSKTSANGSTNPSTNSPKLAAKKADNFTSPDDSPNFVPCNGQSSCGQAKPFGSASEFQTFLNRNLPSTGANAKNAAAAAPSSNLRSFAVQSEPEQTVDRDFSETNNQEDNVDEADLLKSDGTYIYTISNKILSIILAYPANSAKVISSASLEYSPSAIFLHGNFLAVFGTQTGYVYKNQNRPASSFTFIKIYNIANKGSPFLVREYQFIGRYLNARKLSSGFVYIISNHNFNKDVLPWCDWGSGKVDIGYGNIYKYPGEYVQVKGINILSFNLGNPVNGGRKIISICSQAASLLYMTETNIYLTYTVIENEQDHTVIKKIFVRGLNIVPFGDAKIRGTVINQFSLNEYGPYLRVASTNMKGDRFSNVFVLNYYCQSYGVLTNIAPTERIYAARYVGIRLYLITFNRVDPFFVIEFESMKTPVILGELKITGYSAYLHPMDENTVIGFGRDATESGAVRALKLAVFDVSNPKNPQLKANYTFGERYANSSVLMEHKAFLFSREKNLLVIPIEMNKAIKFNGVFAFTVTNSSIQVAGQIDHLLNANNNFDVRKVSRSLYIEDILYTKSTCLLRINRIDSNFTPVSNIGIPCGQNITSGALIGSPVKN